MLFYHVKLSFTGDSWWLEKIQGIPSGTVLAPMVMPISLRKGCSHEARQKTTMAIYHKVQANVMSVIHHMYRWGRVGLGVGYVWNQYLVNSYITVSSHGRHGVSNYQHRDSWSNGLHGRTTKETSEVNAESVFMSWRHDWIVAWHE